MALLPYPVHGNMETLPAYDHNAGLLLAACGYVCTYYPANWEDVGGPENGPHIIGGPAYRVWEHPCGHEIVIAEGLAQEWGDSLVSPDDGSGPGW